MFGKLFVTLLAVSAGRADSEFSEDSYVVESQQRCASKRDVFSCTKYRVLRYISNYTENSYFEGSLGPIKVMKYSDVDETQTIFSGEEARFLPEDSEVGKFFKFIRRQIDHFLNHQSLMIALPEGARLISLDTDFKGIADSRGKKKKADLLISLLTLFKVFKIKVLVALALAGVLVIKKVLLVGAFILPSVIHNLKTSCMKAAQAASYHHVTSIESEHDDWSGGFGAYGGNNYHYGHNDKTGTNYQHGH